MNSENLPWLDNLNEPLHKNNLLKPDLFVAPRVSVAECNGSSDQGSGKASYVFGRLADRHLQRDGCVRELYEAKLGPLTSDDFGELVKHQRLIPGECPGMLFNKHHFWMFASVDGDPARLERSSWNAPGSSNLIRCFFDGQPPPPLIAVLRRLLSVLGLRLATEGGPAFLGAGASGRVFAVQREPAESPQPQRLALKVVVASDAEWRRELSAEFNTIRAAAEYGAPVVPVIRDSLCADGDDGGGFLLASCGTPFVVAPIRITRTIVRGAFAALKSLHACNVVHGDARLANLLQLGSRVVWVDLARGRLVGPESRSADMRTDAKTLAESILRSARRLRGAQQLSLPAAVLAAVASYDCSSDGSVKALAAAVLQAGGTTGMQQG